MEQENKDFQNQLDLLTEVVQGLTKTVQNLQASLNEDFNIHVANDSESVEDEEVIHKEPPEGATCAALWEDIDESNYCEYRDSSGKWYSSVYCEDVVHELLDTQFQNYKDNVENSTCKASVRSLVKSGPPIWISDVSMPIDSDGCHIDKIWFSSTNTTISAKLKGALEGEERNQLWKRYEEFFKLLPENEE